MRKFVLAALAVLIVAAVSNAQVVNRVVDQIIATTCTNQFARSIAASGAATCATVSLTADVSGITPPANGGTGVANSVNLTVSSATSVGRGQYQGTGTNDAATAGNIGERIDGQAAAQSVSLGTGVAANTGSASLTAGDWEVSCHVLFLPAATTTVTTLTANVSPTSATYVGTLGTFSSANYPGTVLGSAQYTTMTTPSVRVSVASPTTYYCVAMATFGTSTMTAGGNLHAVRVR